MCQTWEILNSCPQEFTVSGGEQTYTEIIKIEYGL